LCNEPNTLVFVAIHDELVPGSSSGYREA